MVKQNKYRYLRILQGRFEGKWVDIIASDKRDSPQEKEAFADDARSCWINNPRPYRIISRRIPINKQFHA